MPSRPLSAWSPTRVAAVLRDVESGRLEQAADLCDEIFTDDRVTGVLHTCTHGLLGLPVSVRAADGASGETPETAALTSDWPVMLPEAELAHLLRWVIVLGVGFARIVPRDERAIGERETPRIEVWHARWFRHEAGQWYARELDESGSERERPIAAGDGEWMIVTAEGTSRPWAFGAWRALAFPWVLKLYASHDMARQGEVYGSPARVGTTGPGVSQATRRQWARELKTLGRDTATVLPDGWKLALVEATGRTWDIHVEARAWADRAISIVLAGQVVTTEGSTGFSNGNIWRDVALDLTRFRAETLATALRDQFLRHWAAWNFGSRSAPWLVRDTTPPADNAAEAETIKTLGEAIASIDEALAASGERADAKALAEKFGVPTVALPQNAASAPTIQLAPTDVAKVVRVNEARASAGLGPLMTGGVPDPDGELTVDEFAAKRAARQASAQPASSEAAA